MGRPCGQLMGHWVAAGVWMTVLAICGMAPLAVGAGSGAQLLVPLAVAVFGGVAVSTVLSLLITPVLYCLLRQRGL